MQKLALSIGKCVPGMRTAEPIINLETGIVIVGQNQILTSHIIENLGRFIHTQIWVYIDSWKKVWNVPEETVQKYEEYTNEFKEILNAPNISEKEVDEIKALAEGITEDFKENYAALGCVNMIKEEDQTIYQHSMNVTFLAMLLGRWMKWDKQMIDKVCLGALIHDIGKLQLPKDIRNKTLNFTREEYDEFKKHTILGYNLLSEIKGMDKEIIKAVLGHHERCDGTGYPLRLTSPNINGLSKIIAIADEYDMLKKTHHIFKAIHIMQVERLQQLDTQMVLTFCENLASYYMGVYVRLNTGDVGEVVFIHPECVYRPIIKVDQRFIDLYEHPELTILEIE